MGCPETSIKEKRINVSMLEDEYKPLFHRSGSYLKSEEIKRKEEHLLYQRSKGHSLRSLAKKGANIGKVGGSG